MARPAPTSFPHFSGSGREGPPAAFAAPAGPHARAVGPNAAARRATEPVFLLAFLACSVAPQLFFAGHALLAGARDGRLAAAELPEGLFAGLLWAMLVCTVMGFLLLQILRYMPIGLVLYAVVGGSASLLAGLGLLVSMGAVSVAGSDSEEPLPFERASTSAAVSRVVAARLGELLLLAAAVELAVVAYFWKEVRLSVSVLRATALFLRDVPSVPALLPPLFGILHCAGLLLWALAVVGAVEVLGRDDELGTTLRECYAVHTAVGLSLCYFWGNGLVTALSSFTTAAAASDWYFARQHEKRHVAAPRRFVADREGGRLCPRRLPGPRRSPRGRRAYAQPGAVLGREEPPAARGRLCALALPAAPAGGRGRLLGVDG
ncbi:unnamed protein product [Prorocentrum cordatum]|uniref:Choline transporter-like protein n=1 Tax=Prorocentrum cordatum TaxID=2364126 RepID=A0ABN9WXI4_9DINO|nr:unnamed protein product [Polarella glacialis]